MNAILAFLALIATSFLVAEATVGDGPLWLIKASVTVLVTCTAIVTFKVLDTITD